MGKTEVESVWQMVTRVGKYSRHMCRGKTAGNKTQLNNNVSTKMGEIPIDRETFCSVEKLRTVCLQEI